MPCEYCGETFAEGDIRNHVRRKHRGSHDYAQQRTRKRPRGAAAGDVPSGHYFCHVCVLAVADALRGVHEQAAGHVRKAN